MKNNALFLAMGLAGLMSVADSANAALSFAVTIQQTDDNGNLVGTAGTRTWDLTTQSWSPTTTDGHTLNDLVNTLSWRNGGTSLTDSASFIVGNLTYDVDPSLSFDATFTNNTAFNQTYSVSYNTPLSPSLSGLINSSANLTAQLTDAGGIGGAFVKPGNGNGNIMRSWDLTVAGNEISKNVDIGSQLVILNGTGSNSWSASNTLICGTAGSACETMTTTLTFTLSKGDKVRLFGDLTQVAAVPVPAAVWLFGSVLAGFMSLRRKQQKM